MACRRRCQGPQRAAVCRYKSHLQYSPRRSVPYTGFRRRRGHDCFWCLMFRRYSSGRWVKMSSIGTDIDLRTATAKLRLEGRFSGTCRSDPKRCKLLLLKQPMFVGGMAGSSVAVTRIQIRKVQCLRCLKLIDGVDSVQHTVEKLVQVGRILKNPFSENSNVVTFIQTSQHRMDCKTNPQKDSLCSAEDFVRNGNDVRFGVCRSLVGWMLK